MLFAAARAAATHPPPAADLFFAAPLGRKIVLPKNAVICRVQSRYRKIAGTYRKIVATYIREGGRQRRAATEIAIIPFSTRQAAAHRLRSHPPTAKQHLHLRRHTIPVLRLPHPITPPPSTKSSYSCARNHTLPTAVQTLSPPSPPIRCLHPPSNPPYRSRGFTPKCLHCKKMFGTTLQYFT